MSTVLVAAGMFAAFSLALFVYIFCFQVCILAALEQSWPVILLVYVTLTRLLAFQFASCLLFAYMCLLLACLLCCLQ